MQCDKYFIDAKMCVYQMVAVTFSGSVWLKKEIRDEQFKYRFKKISGAAPK
ncbi:hypothetical protein EROP_00630 [Erysipelotrichaceae bacterium OPF54]|nr:hypothetical protein EROP_00630 [Erysipelotrichaceae bacterium OPF54]